MSFASPSSSGPPSPSLSPMDSSTALVLVHDEDEDLDSPSLHFEDDPDEQYEFPAPSVPPLSQTAIFIYLLAPLLKLGALLLPNTEFSLKFGLPSLLFFGFLSAFARQIWYNLALYVRNPDFEFVILDSLVRGRRSKETLRHILRTLVRSGTRVLRILLATIYLREGVHSLTPLFPSTLVVPTELALVVVFALLLLPISLSRDLASKRMIYASIVSILCFVVWLGFTSGAYARGTLQTSKAWLRVGFLWRGMTVTAFAFTSSSTLSLYASSKGAMQILANPKKHRHYFRISASLSVAVAAALMLPLVFFSAFPRRPAPLIQQFDLKPFIYVSHAATLLLSVPFLIVTSPPLPLPEMMRRSTKSVTISRTLYLFIIALIAMVPHGVTVVLSDILMVFALSSTYFLPAIVHVIMHQIKRPLSIVLPQTHTYSPLSSPSHLHNPSHSENAEDELLQRKERSLQKRQLRKRIAWDVGVWVLLIPVGGGGFVWMVGEILGRGGD